MDDILKEKLSESYNNNAKFRNHNDIEDWKVTELTKMLQKIEVEKNTSLLDLGAGNGLYGKFFKNKGLEVTCIDLSASMIKLCREKGLNATIMDFYNLKFEENHFDAVWSLNTLLHVPKKNIEVVLKQIKRVLKHEGLFYLGIYGGKNFEGIWEDDIYKPQRFFSFYEDDSIKKLVEKYFKIESFESIEIKNRDNTFQSIFARKID